MKNIEYNISFHFLQQTRMNVPTLFNGDIPEYIANKWIKYLLDIFHKNDNIILYPINVASIYNTTSNELSIILNPIQQSIYSIITTINDIRLYISDKYHSGQYRNVRILLYVIHTIPENIKMQDNYNIIIAANIIISHMYYNAERAVIRPLKW